MKYLGYILAFMLAFSVTIGYAVMQKKEVKEKNIAIAVNDRLITFKHFEDLFQFQKNTTHHMQDKKEFVDTLVTRELLIQAAQAENINQIESFRMAVQDYYEQSLIKILMEKKLSNLKVEVKPDQYRQYVDLMSKKVKITLTSFSDQAGINTNTSVTTEQIDCKFSRLGEDIKISLLGLKVGEHSQPIQSGNTYMIVKLMDVTNDQSYRKPQINKEKIIEMLKKHQKDQIITNWIKDLRKKANIKISNQI